MSVKTIGIAGSGVMGGGVAELVARSGFEVVLRSRAQSTADAALGRMVKSLAKQVEKGKLTPEESEATVERVRVTGDLGDLEPCDLVLESVVEDLDTKQRLFKELDHVCRDDTVLATNTSTLPVGDLALSTGRPDRVVGVHFFNPAPRMPLVEIVPSLTTSDDTVATAIRFAEDCGKEPVTVKDRAGFVVNALLFPYLNGAAHMLDSGTASRDGIDAAMRGGCGFPMGPFELLDLVGLDTSVAILNALNDERPSPCHTPSPLLKRMVAAGHLGRKAGQGFYDYGINGR